MALYDVFVSYSRFDTKAVNSLINRLRHDMPDIKLWYDIEGIESADVFQTKIIEAIDNSETVIFVCSDNSLSSEYCRKEVMYAKNLHKKVVPYLLAGTALKSWLLFEFGTINVVHASKEDEVRRLIKNIKTWKGKGQAQIETNATQSLISSIPTTSQPITSTPTESASYDKACLERNEEPSITITPPLERVEPGTYNQDRLPNGVTNTNFYFNGTKIISEPNKQSNPGKEEPTVGFIKGHMYVDLGLPSGVKWATCNVGAKTPEESGDYFAWSDIQAKQSYDTSSCGTYKKDVDWLRGYGYIGARKQLEMSRDAAREHWGGTWRMPSRKEIEELIKNTVWEWVVRNGVKGYQLKSPVNNNSIFIPAAGYREGKKLYGVGEKGSLWSASTIDGSVDLSYTLSFTSNKYFVGLYNRYLGLSIRPVTD